LVTRDGFFGHVEPDLAVNPANHRNLLGACQFERGPHTRLPGTFASFDAGRTWRDNGVLPLPGGYDQGADTTVAFDNAGEGYVMALLSAGGGGYASRVKRGGIFVWRTRDGGRSFTRPVPVFIGAGFQDHPWFAVMPDQSRAVRLFVTWTNAAGLEFAQSFDGGATFSHPRVLVGGQAPSDPVLTAGGSVVRIVFQQFSGTSINVLAVTSTDTADHFGAPVVIGSVPSPPLGGTGPKGGTQPPPLVAAATDASGRHTAVAISALDPARGHPVIDLWLSSGVNDSWHGPTHPADPADSGLSQTQPRLVLRRDELFLSYFTTTRQGRISEHLAHGTFAKHISSATLSAEPFAANEFIGDYQALAITADTGYAAWNDSRPGHLEIVCQPFPT
jgi:hypothetical protein